jgi:hypothetical protein
MQAYSDDQLAMWLRDAEGGLTKALATNPKVALMYRDNSPTGGDIVEALDGGLLGEVEIAAARLAPANAGPRRNGVRGTGLSE